MTGKRFQWVFIKDNELEFQDNGIVKRFDNGRLEEFLNELHEENEQLKDNELEDRDIICEAGKFRLEEWGKHRYHQFYNGDEPLEDESIVIMLMELTRESEQLKQQLKKKERLIGAYEQFINDLKEDGVLDD